MMRRVRGTPLVRCAATAIATILGICGLVPLLGYPLLRLDAASYQGAIGVAAGQCAGNPIPARGGCWSAASARVTISGVDAQAGTSFVVVDVAGQPATREDFVAAPQAAVTVGTAVTARYWHEAIAELVLAPAAKGAAPAVLPTRDNPSFRATQLPTASALLLLVGAAGLLVWGRPLLDDVRRLRDRRRQDAEARAAVRDSAYAAGRNRGLARYGITLPATDEEVVLTGRRDAAPRTPPPAPTAGDQGGTGWSVRPR